MSRVGWVNGAALVLALAASVALAGRPAGGLGEGEVDATGVRVPVRAYARIASGSTAVDRMLLELCEPERVLAFTAASGAGPDRHRYAGKARVERLDDVERMIELGPDLVLVHNVADVRRLERMRAAGLRVFDLGALRGAASVPDDVRRVAAFCGAPDRAEPYLRAWQRRLDAIARHLPREARLGAIYLSIYGGQLFGGTRGSSYHDVLRYAGLRDQAAERYEGWPQYSAEQVLALDPARIVTRTGMGAAICARAGFETLSACRSGLVEIDGDLLDAVGVGILEAAEAVHAAGYATDDE